MKKKHAPEQYAAKPKAVAAKPNRPPVHPAAGVAKVLVRWLARGGVPPSVILLHGLNYARSPNYDGLPVDTYRPQLKMQGDDNRAISEILDVLAHPHADKTQVIEAWLQANWANKPPKHYRASSVQEKRKTPGHHYGSSRRLSMQR